MRGIKSLPKGLPPVYIATIASEAGGMWLLRVGRN